MIELGLQLRTYVNSMTRQARLANPLRKGGGSVIKSPPGQKTRVHSHGRIFFSRQKNIAQG